MNRRNKIIYWIATIWLCLGMTSTALVQLSLLQQEESFTQGLGYPVYFIRMLAVAKLLGVVVILVPGFRLLKEWAYAGFFFMMTGAMISHLVLGDGADKTFPALLLLVLALASWYFRPAERKLLTLNQQHAI